jgi:hypothetical protein
MVHVPVSSHETSAFLESEARVGFPPQPARQLRCGRHFAVLGEFFVACSVLQVCLPPRLPLPQWLRVHWAAVVFTSKQNTCRYLHVIWICLPPESGNWRREDLHLSSYSALSAAHRSTGVTPLQCYCKPSRHRLVFGRFPGLPVIRPTWLRRFLGRDEDGFSSCSTGPCHRAASNHPAGVTDRFGQPAVCHAAFARRKGARPPELISCRGHH